ncbi:hypothetical protein OG485_31615 [Streptomyces sp. NBC_00328]|nr:hypothetical protein [Streptomyces sp. NBC_00328]
MSSSRSSTANTPSFSSDSEAGPFEARALGLPCGQALRERCTDRTLTRRSCAM